MKFGCCVSMQSTPEDPAGLRYLEAVGAAGFDYVELPIAEMMLLSDGAFEELLRRLRVLELTCPCCNNFFPSHLRLTGAERDAGAIAAYLKRALPRVKALGAQSIVFGSAAAKKVPEGFPMDRAWDQIAEDLQIISDMLSDVDSSIRVAIEPVCKLQSNILRTYAEGLSMARRLDRGNIRCLVDYFHMRVEEEPVEHLLEGEGMLRHVHISNPQGRGYPRRDDGQDYGRFFEILRQIGYDGCVSVEGFTDDFAGDAERALAYLRELARQ